MENKKKVRLAKNMALRVLLASLTGASLTGCSSEEEFVEVPSLEDMAEDFLVEDEEELSNEEIQEIVEEESSKFNTIPSVMATDNVYIRTLPIDGKILGKLVEGHTLERVDELENGWYKVLYYGQEGYVSGEYTEKIDTYQVKGDIKKVCYAVEDIDLTIPEELRKDEEEEIVTLPSLECLEIYEETEDTYLVQTNDYIGYVSKENLGELASTFVVVDISDQELKLYKDNRVILETPVVTGKPTKSRRSDEGLFEIYQYKRNDYLRGRNEDGSTYASYVKIMMYYNNGEGLHDASWRDYASLGGNTWINNGSHGCINMDYDAVVIVDENVSLGTRVLVKE